MKRRLLLQAVPVSMATPAVWAAERFPSKPITWICPYGAGGNADSEALIAAAKGMAWESPRGPMSIDPETRDVVQTIYIRKVEKVNGEPQNVVFDKVENVKDPVKARMPK